MVYFEQSTWHVRNLPHFWKKRIENKGVERGDFQQV